MGWPITLGLGPGEPLSWLFDGLGGGGHIITLSPRRTITPVFPSGYAGRDFPPLSTQADDTFGIDLSIALDAGDALDPSSLTVLFFPVDVQVANYAAALDGPAKLIGTVAVQAIGQPPVARYVLGFACGTASGRRIQIHSYFNAVGVPNAA